LPTTIYNNPTGFDIGLANDYGFGSTDLNDLGDIANQYCSALNLDYILGSPTYYNSWSPTWYPISGNVNPNNRLYNYDTSNFPSPEWEWFDAPLDVTTYKISSFNCFIQEDETIEEIISAECPQGPEFENITGAILCECTDVPGCENYTEEWQNVPISSPISFLDYSRDLLCESFGYPDGVDQSWQPGGAVTSLTTNTLSNANIISYNFSEMEQFSYPNYMGGNLDEWIYSQNGWNLPCLYNGDCAYIINKFRCNAGGCTDETACNFDDTATVDDDSCTFPDNGFDCDGNCIVGEDCTGVCGGNYIFDCSGFCGGNLVNDECGVCDGPGEIYECGCTNIPLGDCDCDGNILDFCGMCGGDASDCSLLGDDLSKLEFREADINGRFVRLGFCVSDTDDFNENDLIGLPLPDNSGQDIVSVRRKISVDWGDGSTPNVFEPGSPSSFYTTTLSSIYSYLCTGDDTVEVPHHNNSSHNYPENNLYTVTARLDRLLYPGPVAQFQDEITFNINLISPLDGCMDESACNFNTNANIDVGCYYENNENIHPDLNISLLYRNCEGICFHDTDGDGVCDSDEILGCADAAACNYDITATDSDNSLCVYPENSIEINTMTGYSGTGNIIGGHPTGGNNQITNATLTGPLTGIGDSIPHIINYNLPTECCLYHPNLEPYPTNQEYPIITVPENPYINSQTNRSGCVSDFNNNNKMDYFIETYTWDDGYIQKIYRTLVFPYPFGYSCNSLLIDAGLGNHTNNLIFNNLDLSQENFKEGCVDSNALNFNYFAGVDDGSCEYNNTFQYNGVVPIGYDYQEAFEISLDYTISGVLSIDTIIWSLSGSSDVVILGPPSLNPMDPPTQITTSDTVILVQIPLSVQPPNSQAIINLNVKFDVVDDYTDEIIDSVDLTQQINTTEFILDSVANEINKIPSFNCPTTPSITNLTADLLCGCGYNIWCLGYTNPYPNSITNTKIATVQYYIEETADLICKSFGYENGWAWWHPESVNISYGDISYYGYGLGITESEQNQLQYMEFIDAWTITSLNCAPNVLGDISGDGVVDVVDIVQLVQHIMGDSQLTDYQQILADVNNDGVVNVADIVVIVNQIMNSGEMTQQQGKQLINEIKKKMNYKRGEVNQL
jgi:hypothetical protein